ncbi:MAG: hypothetical protein D6748_03560 [Calditrichaeota bacterium]|nr:MAG: hypothetical protein D6748_03560 [Calditrichota bacterium]
MEFDHRGNDHFLNPEVTMKKLFPYRFMLMVVLIFSSATLFAQQDKEPKLEALKSSFQKDYLSVGMLLQTVGDFQLERSFSGKSGFSIANMRLKIYGNLDKQFSYFLQANFIRTRPFLDARMSYHRSPSFTLDLGLFKSPFSKELLTGADAIDFVNRSQVVTYLAPGRDIGAQARGSLQNGFMAYRVGIFNGNGISVFGNENNNFLYAARLAFFPEVTVQGKPSDLEIGINFASSRDSFLPIPGYTGNAHLDGERFLFGVDFRWQNEKYLLAGEYIRASLDSVVGIPQNPSPLNLAPSGFHLTGGYMLTDISQVLFRIDQFDNDLNDGTTTLLIFGYNLWPTGATEFQVNYIINTDDSGLKRHQLLINAQIGF